MPHYPLTRHWKCYGEILYGIVNGIREAVSKLQAGKSAFTFHS